MKKLLYLIPVLFVSFSVSAQELDCTVIVNAERAQTTEKAVFQDMELAFAQFLNDQKWTDDNFAPEERIKCQLIIGINNMPSISSFDATVQIQSVRPIFNTNHETSLLAMTQNYADEDWQFEYTESQPLDFNINSFTSNISSILAFYAYVIIGIDYDSFSPLGGTPYYERALTIVNTAQQTGRKGWQQFVSPPRNRYWLIENLMSQQMRPVREGIYDYHRLALDQFLTDPDNSRKTILDVLKKMQAANKVRPNAFLVTLFLYAKSSELVNIFSEGDVQLRRQAYDILVELDPTKTDKYQQILSD